MTNTDARVLELEAKLGEIRELTESAVTVHGRLSLRDLITTALGQS